jgi:imidazolonepropionase-like amidohydrolase
MKMTRLLTGLIAGVAATAAGQDLLPASPAQDHAVFLTGGTVHTVSGETIENGVVGFNDGAITMVGDASVMQIIQLAPGTEIVDVSGHHVYPGLFAAHTQLGLTETSSVRATRDSGEIGSYNPEVRAAVAVNPDSTLLPVARLNGIMLAGVMPTGGRVAGRASVIRLDGWTWEDMTVRGDAGMLVNWPGVRANPGMWRTSPEGDAVSRVQRSLDAVRDYYDTAAAYAVARAADPSHPKDLRLEAMTPYLGGDHADEGAGARRLLVSANDYDQIVSAVSFAAGRGIPLAIVGGRDAPLCAGLLIEHGVPVIIDGVYRFPKRADSPHDDAYTLAARLAEAGVAFCISGADRDGNVRNLPYEAAMASRYGLDPDEAVRAITLSPAEILGVADRYGSLEQGKSATLIVTTGDVLEITSNVAHAFIDGRRVSLKSKQTELRDKYTEKYRQLGIIPRDDAND